MENRKNVKAYPVPKPSYCLSPEDTNSSPETDTFRQTATFAMHEKDTEAAMPQYSLDLQTFVLPSTPEDLLSVGSGHGGPFLFEDIIAESSAPNNISTGTSSLHCPADFDESFPLDSHLQPLSSHPCLQTNQADELTVIQLKAFDSQNQTYLSDETIKAPKTVRYSETSIHHESETSDQNEYGISAARGVTLAFEQTNSASVVTMSAVSSDVPGNDLSTNSQVESKASNPLKFPPCVICNGKASGSHYGAITCEACKGFFMRYLQKKKEFKCTKGGKCEISSGKKGNCSGCRLKKCLALGMSKEMSKVGRYTLTKRTEAIINMKRLEGNVASDSVSDECDVLPVETGCDATSCNLETDLIMRHLLQNTKTSNMSNGFNDMLVVELIQAMEDLEPYGPNVKTKEQIRELHKHQSERYKLKTELFGKMNSVSKDEYNKLYTEFSIDIDGRMADMKIECEDMEDGVARYCNFAKHIPKFQSLPVLDQSNLLKSLMFDFSIIVALDSYNDELRTFITKNGQGYHFDEMADREFSAKLMSLMKDVFCRLQKLDLSKAETALLAALTLVSTDRCKLQHRALVEKIQLAITELLQQEIKKKQKQAARSRFTKIIDSLTYMREMSELYTKEHNLLCKDEVLIQEFPFFEDFVIEEKI
ncbi:vitamin D3 receptor-like [Mercenaria mercenaria]|uniref:vitamin D3 receptor-like n=1 Tax=Mercenaria mercenaria TaxID=6596 RepID=UPI00234E8230|nr:vitamin D3 receptor-like [Mercenaria mercenaria]XP_045173906.2 vitamin D3 receptor-like [Mercenaria mercenaria]XP_045173907.2 vitamin D3 receptor-like [Mercenaria mercenaria]XP_045173908.2 vitamin D3 receptor-like [Mercenaria mercenaria]XP_045173911.2 vitamin D3 receptor-like [Mercenaria mercenaria]XP_053376123.1 vitamin D3 receptor-like [Mercenaria mercenaria]